MSYYSPRPDSAAKTFVNTQANILANTLLSRDWRQGLTGKNERSYKMSKQHF